MSERRSLEFHQPGAPWLHPEGAAEGVWEQQLSVDAEPTDATVLQRYDPGTDTSTLGIIRHEFREEVYVLSGSLTDLTLGQTFFRGEYACRPKGMPHGPYRSDNGVLMLVIRRP